MIIHIKDTVIAEKITELIEELINIIVIANNFDNWGIILVIFKANLQNICWRVCRYSHFFVKVK